MTPTHPTEGVECSPEAVEHPVITLALNTATREQLVEVVRALSSRLSELQAQVEAMREAMQIAADSFRSHGFAVDADELEELLP